MPAQATTTIYEIGESIQNAIEGFVNWISDNIRNFINWLWQAINSIIVQPATQALQSWITGFVQKLPRLLFVIMVIPTEMRLARSLMRQPSLRTIGKMMVVPVFGALASDFISRILQTYLGAPPTTVAPIPIMPPSPPPVYGWMQVPLKIYDEAGITEEVNVSPVEPTKMQLVENTTNKIVDSVDVFIQASFTVSFTEDTSGLISDSVSIATTPELIHTEEWNLPTEPAFSLLFTEEWT